MHTFAVSVIHPDPEEYCRDEVWITKVKEVFHLKDNHCFVFDQRIEQIVAAAKVHYQKLLPRLRRHLVTRIPEERSKVREHEVWTFVRDNLARAVVIIFGMGHFWPLSFMSCKHAECQLLRPPVLQHRVSDDWLFALLEVSISHSHYHYMHRPIFSLFRWKT